jgi:isopentenyl phosphate kinase
MASEAKHITNVLAGAAIVFCLGCFFRDYIFINYMLDRPKARPTFACVVKLGGSACTNKNEFETFDEISVAAAARQLRHLAQSGSLPLLIHGAGSFGHFQAREYAVAQGGTLTARLLEGFTRTRASVLKLNSMIVDRLAQAPMAVVGISPGSFVQTSNRSVVENSACARNFINQIENLAKRGLCPVVHGDACLDESINCTILSGDALFIWFCRVFRPRYAVFLTDVAGVFTRPPTEEGADLLTTIKVNVKGELVDVEVATNTRPHDVTGGIKAKLKVACQVASELGIPVYIVQVGSKAAEDALKGLRPKLGTTVERV